MLFCTPIYWYGMSAQTAAFFDRSFSHYAGSGNGPEDVKTRMQGKRLGLAVASEETYPGAALGIVHQIQEFARYTHSTSSASCMAPATAGARSRPIRASRCSPRRRWAPNSSRANTRTTG